MMRTEVYTTPEAFDRLAGEWNALLKRSASDTLFLTNEWQKTWWRELGEGELRILAMYESDALVGIAPLFFAANPLGSPEVALVGCKEVSDYLDFIFARGREVACFRAVVDFLKSTDAPAWHTLALCNIIETSPTLSTFAEMLNAEGWHARVLFEDVCPVVALPDTFEAYLAMLEGKERRELQRKLRRASEDVTITFATDATSLARDVDDFIALMKASAPSKAAFMTPRMARFFHAAARAMFEVGRLQLAFLEVEGVRAAAYMNFVYGDAVLVYNSGLDPEKYAYLSPGQVLIARLIEKAIQDGRRLFDFLQGDEEYKYKLGGRDVKLYTLSARR
jgi:CelD/BcsL family acetyltransferase involved in cellulose biosynthesis